jgi:hypothetical protein
MQMPPGSNTLKARSNVNAISKDVLRLNDYVTDIDANAESNAPFFDFTDF